MHVKFLQIKLRLRERLQFHDKGRALPFSGRFGADGAMMRLDHLLGHEEAQARAADVDLVGVVGAAELLEEARQGLGRDADAGVLHGEDELVMLLVERESSRDRALSRVLHGVVDDVGDHLLQLIPVGGDAIVGAAAVRRLVGREGELEAGLVDVRLELGDGVLDEHPEVDGLEGVLHGAELDPAHVQVVVDDGGEGLGGLIDAVDALPGFVRQLAHVAFEEERRVALHGGQGRAQLVRGERDEFGLLTIELGQAVIGFLEVGGEEFDAFALRNLFNNRTNKKNTYYYKQ